MIYYLLYGPFGFADTDQGFIPALSYRISIGEIPYLDFDYVRPPLSPLLHRLELYLPDAFEMRAMRFHSYLMVWASVLFSLLAFRRHFELKKLGTSTWILASLAFVFSMHNFPPMPWNTVDGVFFGSLGIYLLSLERKGLILGLFSLFLAAMAKQPFAVLFPIGCLMAFKLHAPKKAILGIAGVLGLIALIAIVVQLKYAGFLQAMLKSVTGTTTFADLFASGIQTYFLPLGLFILPSVLGYFLTKSYPRLRRLMGFVLLLGIALVPLAHAGLSYQQAAFQPQRLGAYHALLMAAGILLWQVWKRKNWAQFNVLLLMCALAWSSGVSWGYAVPVLYAFPGIAAMFILVTEKFDFELPNWVVPTMTGLAFVGFFLMQQFPYRDAPKWELTENIGQVFERSEGVYTGKDNLVRLTELDFLSRKCEGKFVVLPAMPAAHYLTNTKPIIGIDWTHDGELQPDRIQENYAILQASKAPIFVENSRMEEATAKDKRYRSTLLKMVLENYQKTDWHPHGYYSVYVPKE